MTAGQLDFTLQNDCDADASATKKLHFPLWKK